MTEFLRSTTTACRSRTVTVTCRILGDMAQPHKGPRKQIKARWIDPEVKAQLLALAEHYGLELSPYVADLMAIHVGRPDLAMHLVPQMFKELPDIAPRTPDTTLLAPRLPVPVYAEIHRLSELCGMKMAPYVAAVCTSHVRHTPLPLEREVLPLGA